MYLKRIKSFKIQSRHRININNDSDAFLNKCNINLNLSKLKSKLILISKLTKNHNTLKAAQINNNEFKNLIIINRTAHYDILLMKKQQFESSAESE